MFPSIDNKIGIESVQNILLINYYCLNYNNAIFNNQDYLQVDGSAQGPHMFCSYGDIATYAYGLRALSYVPAVKCWKCFRDDMFVLWEHSRDNLDKFFNFMNSIDSSKKI